MKRLGIDIFCLSERNLKALLAKVQGHPPNSRCLLMGDGFMVIAQKDEEHYDNRPAPGPMHPETEAEIN